MHSRYSLIIGYLKITTHCRWYWLGSIACGFGMMIFALIEQHVLNEQPCLMCIHVRLWVILYIIVATIGLLVLSNRVLNSIAHFSVILVSIGFLERSYQLLGTERGFVISDCGFDLGLPAWFAIEEWFPWLFRVETTCGYTPEIIFGITLAEALMAFSICLFLLSLSLFSASLLKTGTE